MDRAPRVNERFECVERFKLGRTHVTDEGRCGRPSTSRTDHINTADAMIRESRRITVSEVVAHLDYVEK